MSGLTQLFSGHVNKQAVWLYGGGVSLLGCLWPIILLVSIFALTQGPSWRHVHLSAKMDPV